MLKNEDDYRFVLISAPVQGKGSVGTQFGFFRYAEDLCHGLVPRPLRQIYALVRTHANLRPDLTVFLVEERVPLDAFMTEEVSTLQKMNRFKPLNRLVTRVSFFSTDQPVPFKSNWKSCTNRHEDDEVFAQLCGSQNLHCLGYVNVCLDFFRRTLIRSYTPEAVLEPLPPELSQHYVHSKAVFHKTVRGKLMANEGSFFAQQQGDSTCCGHAAVQVALQNIFTARGKDNPLSYSKMNDVLAVDHRSRFARHGLGLHEIVELLEWAGLDAEPLDRDWLGPKLHPDDIIASTYYSVESGLPAILCFSGDGAHHAMAVVGHTFDQWQWSAKADDSYFGSRRAPYKASHSWVGKLIVQDDNFGPYSTLFRPHLSEKCPRVVLPRFPWSKRTSPAEIEQYACHLLVDRCWESESTTLFGHSQVRDQANPTGSNFWYTELERHIANGTFVLRTTPTTKSEYWDFFDRAHVLGKIDDNMTTKIRGLLGPNNETRLWCVEINIPELYQHNNRKLGEIIIFETDDPEPWPRLIRLPGVVIGVINFSIHEPEGADVIIPAAVQEPLDIVKRRPEQLAALF